MTGTSEDESATPKIGTDYPAFSYTLFNFLRNGDKNLFEAFYSADEYVVNGDYMCFYEGPNQDPQYDDGPDDIAPITGL